MQILFRVLFAMSVIFVWEIIDWSVYWIFLSTKHNITYGIAKRLSKTMAENDFLNIIEYEMNVKDIGKLTDL